PRRLEEAMTDDDDRNRDGDARQLAELGGALAPLDLDTTTAEQIARRARDSVGKPPSRRRWILPIAAAILTVSYAVWAILKAFEVLQ
ncbi:MAG TPA: hypothetical protein VN253_25595, partial [Kofleriaceae bacterium]|nr:hypothetical protein [Kofleriaceae bacterium]